MSHYFTEKALLELTQAIAHSDHQDEVDLLVEGSEVLIKAVVLMRNRGAVTLAELD